MSNCGNMCEYFIAWSMLVSGCESELTEPTVNSWLEMVGLDSAIPTANS